MATIERDYATVRSPEEIREMVGSSYRPDVPEHPRLRRPPRFEVPEGVHARAHPTQGYGAGEAPSQTGYATHSANYAPGTGRGGAGDTMGPGGGQFTGTGMIGTGYGSGTLTRDFPGAEAKSPPAIFGTIGRGIGGIASGVGSAVGGVKDALQGIATRLKSE